MEKWRELLWVVPDEPAWRIDWKLIEQSGLSPMIEKMKVTWQNPKWHGEGDVWTHTVMVCEELVSLEGYRLLERRKQEEVFLAALLHDIGKIPCTRTEDGVWVSPNHTSVGSRMAREFLWLEYGFCGTADLQGFRETICTLIRYHSAPPHVFDRQNPERYLIRIASDGELLPDFSIELLCLLEEADMAGRLSDSVEQSRMSIELCRLQAEEAGCLKTALRFPDAFSEYAYLSGREIMPGQQMYDNSWREVILMGGLPGTGKDTWIQEQYCGYSVISLDALRRRLKIAPTAEQGAVISEARFWAKEYLRRKTPFVWNATSLTPMIRGKQLRLFTDYGAFVKIVYLETDWEEQMRRNREREDVVPEKVIRHMLGSMTLPERFEAHEVEWVCV